ncbi:MAG: hypothetical protein ACR2QK_05940, partial [Acidimicrobiales bacterium]
GPSLQAGAGTGVVATAMAGGSSSGVPVTQLVAQPSDGPIPGTPVPRSGTAILSSQGDLLDRQGGQSGPLPIDGKPSRKQRKAARKAAKNPPDPRPPRSGVMPIEGRQRPTKTIVAALIVGGLVVSGLLLASLLDPAAEEGGAAGAAPVMIQAEPFDPRGDGTERADLAPGAIDGDSETLWRTDTYRRAGLGGLKPGVGLILTLENEAAIGEMEFLTANEGWQAQVFVANEFGPNDASFDPGSLGEPAAVIEDGNNSELVSLGGATGSRILLWITETGITLDRNNLEVFRFVLFEVSAR